MILGVLSDTHGRAQQAEQAVVLLRRLGVSALVHCGDVGGPAVLDALAGVPSWFVWGNTDDADPGLARYAESLGVHAPPKRLPLFVDFGPVRVAVCHGHEPEYFAIARAASEPDGQRLHGLLRGAKYLLYGHTHEAALRRAHDVWMLNPGALHRADVHTAATIDLDNGEIAHWIVEALSGDKSPQRVDPSHLT